MNTPIFSQNTTSKYEECSSIILDHCSVFMIKSDFASRIHASSSALQLLVTFMITQWSTLRTSTRTRATLKFLVICLQRCFRPAYDVFYQQRCLKFLATQPVSSWSASLVRAYVIGFAVAIHLSRNDLRRSCKPLTVFTSLKISFLCVLPWQCTLVGLVHQVAGNPDITTALAQIRPLDPAWSNCRQRLRELAEDENFIVGSEGEEPEIEESEIKERRCNIRKAIKTLDKFFSDIPPRATASFGLVQLSPTLLSLDVAEESLARAAATAVLVRSRRSPATFKLASTTATG